MKARISGLGQWLPERVRSNQDWPAEFAERAKLSDRRELVDVSLDDYPPEDRIALGYFAQEKDDPFLGTTERRVADPTTEAPAVEALAATAALEDAQLLAKDVDLVLSWAAVPDRAPGGTPLENQQSARRWHGRGMRHPAYAAGVRHGVDRKWPSTARAVDPEPSDHASVSHGAPGFAVRWRCGNSHGRLGQ
jgi:hypothetical protein